MTVYGIITGEFDVDPDYDAVEDLDRFNDSMEIEKVKTIETSRDVSGLNVKIIGNASAFAYWMIKNGIVE